MKPSEIPSLSPSFSPLFPAADAEFGIKALSADTNAGLFRFGSRILAWAYE